MKTLIFYFLLLAVTAFTQAQEIQLEEARVGFAPIDAKITRDADAYSYRINESYAGQFMKDPIAFMKENFDINNFLAEVEDEDYDSFQVIFRSGQGLLKAHYDNNGELVRTYQKFENIVLPLDVRREVYNSSKGWTMIENKYIASGNSDLIEKEVYKVKLEKGNKTQTIKLDGRSLGRTSVASN